MLCSSDEGERRFALQKILKVRNNKDIGDRKCRKRRIPRINPEARSLLDLINWRTEEISEPILTCCLKKQDVLQFFDNSMIVPNFPVYGQSIEQIVKEVTRASMVVYGGEKRDRFIRATMVHRELISVCQSKKDLFKML